MCVFGGMSVTINGERGVRGGSVDFSFFTLLFDVYSGNVFNFIAEFIASRILVYFQAISRVCVCGCQNKHTHRSVCVCELCMSELMQSLYCL